MTSLPEYLDYLIPPPNKIQPKFMAWVEANLKLYTDAQSCINLLNVNFELENAVGDQLDVVGEILGQSRLVDFNPGGGLSSILDDNLYRLVLRAKILLNTWKGTIPEIYDFWERWFPQYKIIIQDNQDMSMEVVVFGIPNDLGGALIFGYGTGPGLGGYGDSYWNGFNGILRGLMVNNYFVPKPAGVSVNYTFIDDPVFSYDTDTDLLKGYDEGYWIGDI